MIRIHGAEGGGGVSGLEAQVAGWIRLEAEDRELPGRVRLVLGEIRTLVDGHRLELERRKGRIIQTGGFREATLAMEAALARVQRLLEAGRNVSAIFSAIDDFLERCRGELRLDREHLSLQLAEARDDQLRRIHESIRGTSLAKVFDILFAMPYSSWRPRGVERRNFRSPTAAEVQRVLEEGRRHGVDVDAMDAVELAAVIRIRLGISPRMDYHNMPSSKLAERLTSDETVAAFASKEAPLDPRLHATTSRMLADLRRWSAEFLGGVPEPVPPGVEAELLQIAYCAGDLVRVAGTGTERLSDFLWLLSTVVASDSAMLADVLARPFDRQSAHPSVRDRLVQGRRYLDAAVPVLDAQLAARWAEAGAELEALVARTDAIVSAPAHGYGEHAELERLKGERSDVVKSLIKLSDSLQLVEPALVEALGGAGTAAGPPRPGEDPRARDRARIRDRNAGIAEQTAAIARQELERLRQLIGRMTEISRKGFGDAGPQGARDRRAVGKPAARMTTDGADLAAMTTADVHARLQGTLRQVALAAAEVKGRVEAARRRNLKGELQQGLNVLHEKVRRALEACDGLGPDDGEGRRAVADAETVAGALREVMAAHVRLVARVGTAKLTPAEKRPVATLLANVKARLGDGLRDLERLRAELVERDEDGGKRA